MNSKIIFLFAGAIIVTINQAFAQQYCLTKLRVTFNEDGYLISEFSKKSLIKKYKKAFLNKDGTHYSLSFKNGDLEVLKTVKKDSVELTLVNNERAFINSLYPCLISNSKVCPLSTRISHFLNIKSGNIGYEILESRNQENIYLVLQSDNEVVGIISENESLVIRAAKMKDKRK